ncbi:hypothetical protein Ancab_032843, partial [Ancistrocladus abbreviatus]
VEEPGSESYKGFSRGIFEIGDGRINEDINDEKDNDFYTLEAPDSYSATEKLRERIGLNHVGRGTGTKGIRKIMIVAQTYSERIGLEGWDEELGYLANVLKAQREIVVENIEECSRPSKSPRTRRNSTQAPGALVEFQSDEDTNLLKLPNRWGLTNFSWPQCEKGRQRCVRRRSLEEILKSSCRVKISGPRSSRASRKKGPVWEKNCMKAKSQNEETNSGMDLTDSQILNMNCILCEQEGKSTKNTGLSPKKILSFISQIEVKGSANEEEIL